MHTHIHGHRQSGAENAEWIMESLVIRHGSRNGDGVTFSMSVEQQRGAKGRIFFSLV